MPVACGQDGQQRTVPSGVRVRSGCALTVAEATIRMPRFLRFGAGGELYVSVPNAGQIKACRDKDGDGHFETVTTFVDEHPTVHGLFWHDGWLWFTESGAIFRAQDTDGDGRADREEPIIPRGKLPEGGHWWRPVLIHGGRLYTGIGDSGNVTDETDSKRQKIWSYALDGSDERLFCSGIRNTEKLVVRPGTDEIWGMDHGGDWFGRFVERRREGREPRDAGAQREDSVQPAARGDARQPITDIYPPDEMNRYEQGGFYGHPFIVGHGLPRYEYMDRADIVALAAKTIRPQWLTGAHWAPNAMEFYTGRQFPNTAGSAFVAYHGSWNRTTRAGYCVTLVLFENGRPYGEQEYVSFLTESGEVLGRPVDVCQAPDGSLLISDDHGHRIYRLCWTGAKP
ncbi:MAG: hypothetical protein AB1716_06190 [Planctomycetota bacterium]